MPIGKYDKFFGGKGGASKAKAAMAETYPSKKKAEEVFYATKNKKKKKMGGFGVK